MNIKNLCLIMVVNMSMVCAMQRFSLVGVDGDRVDVDKRAWQKLSNLVFDECDEIYTPVPSTSLQRIDQWLTQKPIELFTKDIDFELVHDLCQLQPAMNKHPFHRLAQQVAYMHQRLYNALLCYGGLHECAGALQDFLHKWPQNLLPYVNLYMYLLLSDHAEEDLNAQFDDFVHHDNAFAAVIQNVPVLKDQALAKTVVRGNAAYSVYLLLLGARTDQLVPVPKQCFCSTCSWEDIIDTNRYTPVPLVKFCQTMMPSVYAIIQQLSVDKKPE